MPNWSYYISSALKLNFEMWPNTETNLWGEQCIYFRNIINDISNECFGVIDKLKRKGKDTNNVSFKIFIFKNFTDTENELITNNNFIDQYTGKILGTFKNFKSFVNKCLVKYPNWLNYIDNNNQTEFDMISTYVTMLIHPIKCHLIHAEPSDETKFTILPGKPKVQTIFD